jgi:purine-binding chemotaxis protein CheW
MKKAETESRTDIQIVIFRLQNEEFGIPINQVREIVRLVKITHIPEAPGFIVGVINLRGEVIPVIDLTRQFGLPRQAQLPKTARIVVVEMNESIQGMIVDEVPEV